MTDPIADFIRGKKFYPPGSLASEIDAMIADWRHEHLRPSRPKFETARQVIDNVPSRYWHKYPCMDEWKRVYLRRKE
jgi:hypothetical protein